MGRRDRRVELNWPTVGLAFMFLVVVLAFAPGDVLERVVNAWATLVNVVGDALGKINTPSIGV